MEGKTIGAVFYREGCPQMPKWRQKKKNPPKNRWVMIQGDLCLKAYK